MDYETLWTEPLWKDVAAAVSGVAIEINDRYKHRVLVHQACGCGCKFTFDEQHGPDDMGRDECSLRMIDENAS
jgi:hypothetical protein